MCHTSPTKLLRSVKRMTKFLEKKPSSLCVTVFPSINIFLVVKSLNFSPPFSLDVIPTRGQLSSHQACSINIPLVVSSPVSEKQPLTMEGLLHIVQIQNSEMMKKRNEQEKERERERRRDMEEFQDLLDLPP